MSLVPDRYVFMSSGWTAGVVLRGGNFLGPNSQGYEDHYESAK